MAARGYARATIRTRRHATAKLMRSAHPTSRPRRGRMTMQGAGSRAWRPATRTVVRPDWHEPVGAWM